MPTIDWFRARYLTLATLRVRRAERAYHDAPQLDLVDIMELQRMR